MSSVAPPVPHRITTYRKASGYSSGSGDLHFDPLPEPTRIGNTGNMYAGSKDAKVLTDLLSEEKQSRSGLGGLQDIRHDPNER